IVVGEGWGRREMGGYLRTQTAVAAGHRPAAILTVLLAAALLVSAPALVAILAILDSSLISAARDWASGLSYLAHARVVIYVPLLAMVMRAREPVSLPDGYSLGPYRIVGKI